MRGDEVEVHRRLVRSGLPFGTCLTAKYLHPHGSDEFRPILGGLMHTQYPDDPVKRFFTYRNRGYVMSQPGMRRLLPQEWVRFGWYFLVTRRDPVALREWIRLRRLGRALLGVLQLRRGDLVHRVHPGRQHAAPSERPLRGGGTTRACADGMLQCQTLFRVPASVGLAAGALAPSHRAMMIPFTRPTAIIAIWPPNT